MSGITKCVNTTCPLAATCYRTTAPSSDWQSYASFEYEVDSNDVTTCGNYYDRTPSEALANINVS